jgi:hypothetical protein
MGKPCTVCVHPDRSAIDAALEAGHPLRRTAGAYGVSKTALHRHRQAHVSEGRPAQSSTRHQTPASASLTTQRGFWSGVKTIVKWAVGIGICVGYGWLVVTAPQPTPGTQGQAVPRV